MKLGIVICDRYRSCDGGKCFRAAHNLQGAFSIYDKVEVVGYSSCGGCPGGNIENVITNMQKYGAEAIHLASGFLAGYPPCPYISTFTSYIEENGMKAVVGTHPMPTNYINMHAKVGDWNTEHNDYLKKFALIDPDEAKLYDSSIDGYFDKLEK